jgi:hypothetical protein
VQVALTQYWPGVGAPVQLDDALGNPGVCALMVASALMAQLAAEPAGGQLADAEPGGVCSSGP